jgi:hypothetical protein
VELNFVPAAVLHVRCRDTLRGLLRQASHWAEYSMLVYKMYRPVETKDGLWLWKRYMKQSKRLLRSITQIRFGKANQALWVWRFGWQLGRLIGSIKYHVPPV